MEIERRGKFPGVKVHLDAQECKLFVSLLDIASAHPGGNKTHPIVLKLSSKIAEQLEEDTTILKPRTQDEIIAELQTERDKAIEKLAKIEAGKKWSSK